MSEFNLLEEPWLIVMIDEKGTTKEVSLRELFEQAHNYIRIAGETPAQDFVVLRFLLAIMHTVFSRFDSEGEVYEYIKINEKFVQKEEIDEDDRDDYLNDLKKTWKSLWQAEKLPRIINEYLEKWHDRFYLYDEKYPFYQVTADVLENNKIIKNSPIRYKLINRLISESNNKVELFSPISDRYKDLLTSSELARWLVAYQGYTGTADKSKYPGMDKGASKGWLLGLGGIYLLGNSIRETLILNMSLYKKSNIQTPVWEKSYETIIDNSLYKRPDNVAELYTNWSRLIFMDKVETVSENLINTIQLPAMDSTNYFIEEMTLWQKSKNKGKDSFEPKTHNENQSFWRAFGQMCPQINSSGHNMSPGIINWHTKLVEDNLVREGKTTIVAVGLNYNRDPSNMINGEIFDEINISNEVLADVLEGGWVPRISDEVELIKETVNKVLKKFAYDIKVIRNLSGDGFEKTVEQEVYFALDLPFREWISKIQYDDSKEEQVKDWRIKFKRILDDEATHVLRTASNRDYLGRVINLGKNKSSKYMNIQIAYSEFQYKLKEILKV